MVEKKTCRAQHKHGGRMNKAEAMKWASFRNKGFFFSKSKWKISLLNIVLNDKVAHDFVLLLTSIKDLSHAFGNRNHRNILNIGSSFFSTHICRQSKYLPIIFSIKRLKVHHFHSFIISLSWVCTAVFCPPSIHFVVTLFTFSKRKQWVL